MFDALNHGQVIPTKVGTTIASGLAPPFAGLTWFCFQIDRYILWYVCICSSADKLTYLFCKLFQNESSQTCERLSLKNLKLHDLFKANPVTI